MASLLRPGASDEGDGGRGGYLLGLTLLAVALGAGAWGLWLANTPERRCQTPDEPLNVGVSCAQGLEAVRYGELLAARRLPEEERARLLQELHEADPASLVAGLEQAGRFLVEVRALRALEAARARSEEAWRVSKGEGAFPAGQFPRTSAVLNRGLAPWSVDDDERLVLTEMDVEGWIRYASLCREVQGGGAVSASVASRVAIYSEITDRFGVLDRSGKVAMTAVGPFWTSVRLAWQAASYERQQAWITAAPLPPPMTATSLAYVTEVVEGDVEQHVRILHEQLGPLDLDVAR
jgi:hypothetical protein